MKPVPVATPTNLKLDWRTLVLHTNCLNQLWLFLNSKKITLKFSYIKVTIDGDYQHKLEQNYLQEWVYGTRYCLNLYVWSPKP